MSQWPETETVPAPGDVSIAETLDALIKVALADGQAEVDKASEGKGNGIIRLNITLAVRHGRKQGASTSLVYERKLGS